MTEVLRCSGCDTGYDVGGREPGQRLRCPRCKTVLTVPEPSPFPMVSESAVLRRARGSPCAQHPKAIARARCTRCGNAACRACVAPAPIDHLCTGCADALGLGGAIPIDLGLLETPRLAARAFARQVLPILIWAVSAMLLSGLVWALPAVAGAAIAARSGLATVAGAAGLGLAIVSAAGFLVLSELLLIPAGTSVLVDDALRDRVTTTGASLQRTWGRVVRNLPGLATVFAVYLLLAVLVVLPALPVGAWLGERTASWTFAAIPPVVALLLGGLLLIPALGLAVPVVVLEERPALEALGRSWRLARLRYPTLLGLTGAFALGYAIALGLGIWGPAATGVISRVLDLLAPALLVTAYHGLAAEDAGVLGRGT